MKKGEVAAFAFVLEHRAIDGWGNIVVSKDEYEQYMSRPIELVAMKFGVSVAEYLEWVEVQGRVRCIATNRNRKQCKCEIPGVVLECNEWVKASKIGGYCSIHGGAK